MRLLPLKNQFQLIAAPPTPLRSDGELNLAAIEPLALHLARSGVDGVFVCGTTGEGASLSTGERLLIAERWIKEAAALLEVIVHVGHAAQIEAVTLAAHAQRVGAAAIATTAPYYFKPQTAGEVVEWLAPVAAAAPELPFFYYHIPSFTGVALPVAPILEMAIERIPNFAGVKFTHENLADYSACLEVDPRLQIFFGRDEILLSALVLGARGAVGSTYNFLAPLFRELLAAFERGDLVEARAKQALARRYVELLIRHGGLCAMKLPMEWLGIDCGPWRAPLRNFDAAKALAFRREWEAVETETNGDL